MQMNTVSVIVAVLCLFVAPLNANPSRCLLRSSSGSVPNDSLCRQLQDMSEEETLVSDETNSIGDILGEDMSSPDVFSGEDDEALYRSLRAEGHKFMRFGRDPEHKFMRFGREPEHKFMRFGRQPDHKFLRFGRQPEHNFMRFGRQPAHNFMRFGREPQHVIMRFGRSVDASTKSRSESKEMPRISRQPEHNFMRFGRNLPLTTDMSSSSIMNTQDSNVISESIEKQN